MKISPFTLIYQNDPGADSGGKGKQSPKRRRAEHMETALMEPHFVSTEKARRLWATVNKESGGGKKSASRRKKESAAATSSATTGARGSGGDIQSKKLPEEGSESRSRERKAGEEDSTKKTHDQKRTKGASRADVNATFLTFGAPLDLNEAWDRALAIGDESKSGSSLGGVAGQIEPALVESLEKLPPDLTRTLLNSSYTQVTLGTEPVTISETLMPVVQDLERGEITVTAALWDLDARIGRLPELLEVLNSSQTVFTFFELHAPVPSGLVIQSEHFATWARNRLDKRVTRKDLEEFRDNLMFDDFYKFARKVHRALGVDYLVGITKQMVAFEEKESLAWNHFSHSKGHLSLVSTYDVLKYAQDAGRPFEVAVGIIVVARLLVMLNPRLKYHEDRGCILDYVKSRELREKIRCATIEPDCLELIDDKYRDAASAMLKALREYSAQPDEPKTEPPEPLHDDEYWRKKLRSLSKQLRNA
jgi:hypothetical protein